VVKTSLMQSPSLDLPSAVEAGFFLLPALPGQLSSLPFPDLRSRLTPISSPFANVVGAARLTSQSADSTIASVIDFFIARRLSFGWRVGPSSTPPDLGQRLLAAGLQRLEDIHGLCRLDLSIDLPTDPSLTIRQAGVEELDLLVDLLEEAFSYHAVWAPILGKAYLERHAYSEGRIAVYLAFEQGIVEPIAFGSLYFLPDQPVAMLSGAGTRPAYRRRGIYSQLIAHRLRQARASGAAASVIQAAHESAEACRKLGFTQFCALEHYIMEIA
jgi:GNAT superfamily N-acetyltransferase